MNFSSFLAKNLVRRRTRTILTAVGIAISVGAMVALLSIARRFSEANAEAYQKRGVDLVVIARGVIDQLNSDLDEDLVPTIRAIPGVRDVAAGLIELIELQRGESNISVLVQGWPLDTPHYGDIEIVAGRRLLAGDQRKLMLGQRLADNLGKGVGDVVKVQGESFEVVGVFKSFVVYENGGAVFMLGELQEMMARPGSVTGFTVICDDAPDKPALVARVKATIESLPASGRKKTALSAMGVQDYVGSAVHLRIAQSMAWLVSAIAVLIGTVGMLNTMVMSVLERVKEIGILRAVGWPRGRVIRMVLGESVMLGLAGAALGILGALLLVKFLVTVPAVNGFIDGYMSTEAILQGVGVTLVMGLVGGAYPAYRASRLDPTEALRHE